MTANIAQGLIQHYVDNFRKLPWRSPPGKAAPDPYRVWLSEVMLQQTTVATVRPRFERFVRRWPNINALAAAADEDVLAEWAGLGYYARARNLIACAREVARRGGFPRSLSELRQLPGVGAYTSAAIMAIAYGQKAPAVDTNVARIMARLHGFRHPSRAAVERLMLEMMPLERPGDFVQAIMDLGATLCRPVSPQCGQCPIASECVARASGTPDHFPEKRRRAARPHRYGTAYWTESRGRIWLIRRAPQGLLGGMAALPGGEWCEAMAERSNPIATVNHIFTHFSLDLQIVPRADPVGEGWWQPLDRLDEIGLPTLYRKAIGAVLESLDCVAA